MFLFTKDYVLQNEILEISPLNNSHLDGLFRVSYDESIWEHFIENGYGQKNFESYILSAIDERKKENQYPMVIKDLRTNHLIGMTRIYEVDNELRNVKLGHSWIGKSYQGTGLNKACKYLLFKFLFEEIGMERIGFGASAKNLKSINALKSVGCQIEGELRHFLPVSESSERISIILLSILKKDWYSGVKTQLLNKINKLNITEL